MKRQVQKAETKRRLLERVSVDLRKGPDGHTRQRHRTGGWLSHCTMFVHFKSLEDDHRGDGGIRRRIALRRMSCHREARGWTFCFAHTSPALANRAFYTRLVIENRLLPPAARDAGWYYSPQYRSILTGWPRGNWPAQTQTGRAV